MKIITHSDHGIRRKVLVATFNAITLAVVTALVASLSYSIEAQAKQHSQPEETVINGSPVQSDEKWPWMAAVVLNFIPNAFTGYICGGSLVAPDRVLTAAHCVEHESPPDIDVVLNRSQLSNGRSGHRIRVKGISIHPKYPLSTDRFSEKQNRDNPYDVALLQLSDPVGIQPVQLATSRQSDLWAPGQPATVLGYGNFTLDALQGSTRSDVLQEGNLNMVSDRECQAAYGTRFDAVSMICAEDMSEPRVTTGCSGDSGGPLVVNRRNNRSYQIGVVSWGANYCTPSPPNVFARVSAMYSFITAPESDLVFKPYSITPPQVTGSSRAGNTVLCTHGTWGGSSVRSFSYRWTTIDTATSKSQDIEGATSQAYELQNADVGKAIYCSITAINRGGYGSSSSNIVTVDPPA